MATVLCVRGRSLAAAAALVAFAACGVESADLGPGAPAGNAAGDLRFSVRLTGAAAVPANRSPATGTAVVVLAGDELSIAGTFRGLTGKLEDVQGGAVLVHRAPPGETGPIVWAADVTEGDQDEVVCVSPSEHVTVCESQRVGAFSLGRTLTAAERTALLANELYLAIHTRAYPGAEIRAQLRRAGIGPEGGSGGPTTPRTGATSGGIRGD